MIDVLRQSPALNLAGNQVLKLSEIRAPAHGVDIHAEAKLADSDERAGIVFGAPNSAIPENLALNAAKEANLKNLQRLIVIGFAIEANARRTIENLKSIMGLPGLYVQANSDLVIGDLLKNAPNSQLFAVCGLPDVALRRTSETNDAGDQLYEVELRGLDVFNPSKPENDQIENRAGDDVPCWMLDPDYDGQCFRAGQVFFPRTKAWDKIKRAIKADFDESVWDHLAGAISAPFAIGENGQIAVKVIDDRGNELLVVKQLSDIN